MKKKLKKRTKRESLIISAAYGVTWAIASVIFYIVLHNDVLGGVIFGLSGGVLGATTWYFLDRFMQKK
ncbi:hypothetical protein ACERII_13265 [Evansella sp. AB-rgal1]|uniref:hypothetical protein n=1 Tax=Evansella sp. AB-rgal1 TaxID=3242696 RepID=UPI00359E37AD